MAGAARVEREIWNKLTGPREAIEGATGAKSQCEGDEMMNTR